MARLRILVLTSSTGGGHDARAEAFAEWCFQLYRHDVDVRIEHMLERSSVVHRSGVWFYNTIQRTAPWVHTLFYAAVEVLSLLNRRSVSLGAAYYRRVLAEFRPHLILSVHDCLNRGYFPSPAACLGWTESAAPPTAGSSPAAGAIHATGSSRASTCTSRARRPRATTQ